MLNISHVKLGKIKRLETSTAFQFVDKKYRFLRLDRILLILTLIFLVFMFLPWTQFVTGTGEVTTLSPENRPQTIQSAIAGRVEEWFVNEGDYIEKGDTIVHISEVKDKFFDPDLIQRTANQVEAKKQTFNSYTSKVQSLNFQINALKETRDLKLEQAQNKLKQAQLKVQSDSIDLQAVKTQLTIAERQFDRFNKLYKEGLKALTDLENKRVKLQESQAKKIAQENKLLSSKNQVINARIEISSIKASYQDKISKAESERFTALSSKFDTEAGINKLENELTNFKVRSGLNYITAPQNGYINQAIQKGIGETFKAGAQIVSIVPAQNDLAVETFVSPRDLPLVHVGEEVRIIFDGWPVIFFSGWPNLSYGTYGGEVFAIERNISPNGKYRVLIKPDNEFKKWPEAIRPGMGSRTFALLNNVPVWYEIWRQINGFPPDYYQPQKSVMESQKKK
ncbi:MAG: HlyD family efflux transporter periplasmic adaptor subunit [Psychroflexus sp.]|nr:HlyD family efflux transporter periplasmic adaptor subunit [Psychroflexus sp.]MDR9449000.1 HlyD family efflux transporter periplasmic adaptor subunit [Psychroflexus sp.]